MLHGFVPAFLLTFTAGLLVLHPGTRAFQPPPAMPTPTAGPFVSPKASVGRGGLVARLPPLRDALDSILSMMLGGKGSPVKAENALPGRPTPMQVTNRHYILKNPIQPPFPAGLETVVFGTGCFWGTEKMFWKLPGVYSTAVGYAAGFTPNPTYEEVCSGRTGHNEVVFVVYDPTKIAFTDLLRNFWESHDPTQGMGQGNDRGTQYRSGIYPTTPEQQRLAEASLAAYQKAITPKGYATITTEIVPNVPFYYAEDYHQQYLAKPMSRPYCSAQPTGIAVPAFSQWGVQGMEGDAPKLPDAYWQEYGPKPGCTIRGSNAQNEW